MIYEDQLVAARIVTEILLELKALTKPDVSLDALDEIAERMIRERGGVPYNKGYHPSWSKTPFPATVCMSVDFEVCHGTPRGRTLREGDIINYDLSVKYKSGCGDAALTVAVGEISNRKERAMRYGLQALYEGIKVVKAGVPISAIGQAIETFAIRNGYNVIKDYGGHHIGSEMHQEPHIPNYYNSQYDNIFLKEGDVICIEPMLTPGDGRSALWPEDGWTVYTLDRQIVVMWEAMVLIKKDGYKILTKHLPDMVQ